MSIVLDIEQISWGSRFVVTVRRFRSKPPPLSKRARQVLETLYRLEEASAAELLEAVADIPSYSAVRSILRGLTERGLVSRKARGLRYVYRPTQSRRVASQSALSHLLETFFDGSPEKTMHALVDLSRERGDSVDWKALERMVLKARKEER